MARFCLIFSFLLALETARVYASEPAALQVDPVPASLREEFKLAPFYEKAVLIQGFPIVSSGKVSDLALLEAGWLIQQMLQGQDKVRDALVTNKVRFSIMSPTEMTTAIPEHSDLTLAKFWDRRARGLGATKWRPSVSCGEENLLNYPGDPYFTENILIHEFAHAMDEMGLRYADPHFEVQLKACYENAMAKGLYKGKYAANNKEEYWAESVQSWFDTNREDDHDHNHVNTRAELKEYDPEMAKLVARIYGDGPWRYTKPSERLHLPHLKGFDPAKFPTFKWPEELANEKIR